jgi:hypothetical protein
VTEPPLRLLSQLAGWMSVSQFEKAITDYFTGGRSAAEVAEYRTKSGPMKKLRDEVAPMLHYVKFIKAEGEIRFELSDSVPDCWLRADPSAERQGVEITVAQAREQYYLGKELNEKRVGRGFLGLPDDAPSELFAAKLATPRAMYTTDSALAVIGNGIKRCLSKKAATKYAGYDLVIEAPLRSVPNERWAMIHRDLCSAASDMPFRQIHVIGNQDSEPFGFRIK